jgi:hypothetical protein
LFFRHSVLPMQGLLAYTSMVFASASRKLFQCPGRDTLYLAFEFKNWLSPGRSEFESKERREMKG